MTEIVIESAFDRIGLRVTHKQRRFVSRWADKLIYMNRRHKRKKGNKHRNPKTK